MTLSDLTRREFLRRAAVTSAAGAAAPILFNLSIVAEAAAQTYPSDYKAIVCVYLHGGNDYGNTIIPYDQANYDLYAAIRQNLAVSRANLSSTVLAPTTALANARQMALNPAMVKLKQLFDQKKMAPIFNIGTLVRPTTKDDFINSRSLPPKLFSHNDQSSLWQSSMAEGAQSGWGGRIGDLFLNSNNTATFTCISVSGNAVYVSGKEANQYQIGTNGPTPLLSGASSIFGSSSSYQALKKIISENRVHPLEQELSRVTQRSLDAAWRLNGALSSAPTIAAPFDASNSLASQLKMVAKLISANPSLGNKRQIFYVSLGGFDNHDSLASKHGPLLAQVDSALGSFYQALTEIGMQNQVTAFTASDFGRTLSVNGSGSDHGWGSHHFVMGGAVKGGQFYGTLPKVLVDGPEDVGQGRLIPTTSVDQLGWTLAKWFGVPESDKTLVMPNIANFATNTLPIF